MQGIVSVQIGEPLLSRFKAAQNTTSAGIIRALLRAWCDGDISLAARTVPRSERLSPPTESFSVDIGRGYIEIFEMHCVAINRKRSVVIRSLIKNYLAGEYEIDLTEYDDGLQKRGPKPREANHKRAVWAGETCPRCSWGLLSGPNGLFCPRCDL